MCLIIQLNNRARLPILFVMTMRLHFLASKRLHKIMALIEDAWRVQTPAMKVRFQPMHRVIIGVEIALRCHFRSKHFSIVCGQFEWIGHAIVLQIELQLLSPKFHDFRPNSVQINAIHNRMCLPRRSCLHEASVNDSL